MPSAGGTYKPGDVIDIYTVANQLQDAAPAEITAPVIEGLDVDESPSAGEVNALIKRDWPTTSVVNWIDNVTKADDPNFVQPWEDLDSRYFPYSDLFENANSSAQWSNARRVADQAMYDDEMMSRMTAKDWAQYVGGQMIDPLTVFLTFGTAGLYTFGKGATVTQAAVKTGALAAAESAVIEGVLQLTDPLREVEDSAISVLAGGAFGSLVGAGGQALAKRFNRIDDLKGEIYTVFKDEVDVQRAVNSQEGDAPTTYRASDEKPTRNPLRYLLDNPVMRNAQIKMLYSDSPILSRLADKLSSNNILKNGDYNGNRYNGPTLNETIKQSQRKGFRILSDLSYDARKQLRKRGIRLSLDEIAHRATRSARRGGTGDDYDEINRIGQQFRDDMKDWAERGVKMGVLSKEVVDAMDNYVPRIYDRQAILNNWSGWSAKITAHFRAKYPDMEEDVLNSIPREIFNKINSLETHELMPTKFVPHKKSRAATSAHLKGRQLDMEDLDLEDFLVNDVRALSNRYVMGAGSDIMLREQFGADNIMVTKNGVPIPKADYEAGMRELEEQANELLKAGKKRAGKKKQKEMEDMQDSIEQYMRTILHRPIPPSSRKMERLASVGKGIRGYSAAASLGEVVQSAFPDASNNILQHGVGNLLASLPTFFRALPQVFKRAGGKGRVQQHWRDMDIALDNLMSSNIMAIADIEDAHMYGIQRGALHGSEVARKAFRIFLADRWNTGAKLLAATAAERAIIRDAAKLANGTLGKHRSAKMHRIGMTKDLAKRITANVKEHGKMGSIANLDDWDSATKGDLTRLVFRESEFQVVAPDAGEMPEIFDNEVGRLLMQFRTFIVSHTMKQLTPAAQRLAMGDMSVMSALTAMTTFGIMSAFVKDVTRSGFDVDKVSEEWAEKSAADIVAIGLDRGAVLSYLPGILGTLDNQLNGKMGEGVGLTPRASGYRNRFGVDESVPGFGWMGNVGAGTTALARSALPEDLGGKEFTARDLNKLRRGLPLQNTFYLAWLFNMGEEAIVEAADLPESGRKKKSSGIKL